MSTLSALMITPLQIPLRPSGLEVRGQCIELNKERNNHEGQISTGRRRRTLRLSAHVRALGVHADFGCQLALLEHCVVEWLLAVVPVRLSPVQIFDHVFDHPAIILKHQGAARLSEAISWKDTGCALAEILPAYCANRTHAR